jgi:hypothetical protein
MSSFPEPNNNSSILFHNQQQQQQQAVETVRRPLQNLHVNQEATHSRSTPAKVSFLKLKRWRCLFPGF